MGRWDCHTGAQRKGSERIAVMDMQERKVDIDAARRMLDVVKQWGFRPEVKEELARATYAAENSLLGLVLTGVEVGLWPNTPESNQFLLDKLRIAFQMGYYARSVSV